MDEVTPVIDEKTPEKRSGGFIRCPECGSECLDVHVDSKGEIFYHCISCDPGCNNLFSKSNSG